MEDFFFLVLKKKQIEQLIYTSLHVYLTMILYNKGWKVILHTKIQYIEIAPKSYGANALTLHAMGHCFISSHVDANIRHL